VGACGKGDGVRTCAPACDDHNSLITGCGFFDCDCECSEELNIHFQVNARRNRERLRSWLEIYKEMGLSPDLGGTRDDKVSSTALMHTHARRSERSYEYRYL